VLKLDPDQIVLPNIILFFEKYVLIDDCMEGGYEPMMGEGRTPKVGALGDAGAIFESNQSEDVHKIYLFVSR